MSGCSQESHEMQEVPGQSGSLKNKEVFCDVCGRSFLKRFNLIRHQKRVHPVWFASKTKTDNKTLPNKKKHTCDLCKKSFLKPSHLLRHMRAVHKIDGCAANKKHESGSSNFQCYVCLKQFSTDSNMKKHLGVAHNIKPDYKRNLKCSKCFVSFRSRVNFLAHFTKCHDILIRSEKFYFSTKDDFDKWKNNMEKDSSSRFIINKSYKSSSGHQTINFICHRNGKYRNKSFRHLRKSKGTNKIECFCPANILVQAENLESCFPANVGYCSTHLGHKCESRCIPLTMQEKDGLKSNKIDLCSREVDTWIVPSFTKYGETYTVKLFEVDNSHKCNLVCLSCNACLHQYRCSCPESSVKYNFCKHIHFVCQKLKSSVDNATSTEVELPEKEIAIDEHSIEVENERSSIVKTLNTNSSKDFQNDASNSVVGFLGKLARFPSEEQCKEIINTMTQLEYRCVAMGAAHRSILSVQNPIKSNQNIVSQRKFPTKKKTPK